MFCNKFHAVTKRSQMHPNTTKRTKTLVLGPMVGLGPFVAKNPTWLCGTNFCINCTSSPRFASSYMQLRNDPKCTQTLWNTPKHDFRVQWGDLVCSLQKNTTWLHGTNFCFNWTSSVCFATSFMQLQNIPNAPKYYKTDRNISLGSNGVNWVRSLRKIPMWLRVTNFWINCTSWPRFAPSFRQLRYDPKCSQTLCNAPKHEFRVQWSGFGAFVAKNPDVTSGTSFCINCTSWPRFAPSFRQLRNDPKCSQTLCNAPKHEFRVQWSGFGAFVAKNPDMTSCHELLH